MKPRPALATFVLARPNLAASKVRCSRGIHIGGIAPAFQCPHWSERARSTAQRNGGLKKPNGQNQCYASTSTAAARKTDYGGEMAPPPPGKTAKTNVPAKSAKPTVPAKISASTHATAPKSVPVKRSPAATTTVPTLKAKENLNPPHFTYAPNLAVPARKADQNIASYLWKAGRAYLTFYKTGISHVRQTSKLAKTLREKAAKSPNRDITEALTRAEWQVVLRSKKDVMRLPAFGALVLLLGEWLPLVVLYLTPVIPEACRIPQQVQRELSKREQIRQQRLRRVSLDAMRLMSQDRRPAGSTTDVKSASTDNAAVVKSAAQNMTLYELLLASSRYNCHSRIFDLLHITPPKVLLKRNVGERLAYLRKDDALIIRDGGWAALNKEEVDRACVERGIDVLGKKEDELRKALVLQWKESNV